MSHRAAVALVVIATRAAAQPGATPPTATPLPPPPVSDRRPCDEHTFYLEPSLLVLDDGDRDALFHRVAGGARFHSCTVDGAGLLEGRVGATAYLSGLSAAPGGIGLEGELDIAPWAGSHRLGVRAGYESADHGARLYTLGMRYRPGSWSLSLDAFTVQQSFEPSSGFMFGFGLEDRAGRYAVATEGIFAGTLLLLALLMCSSSGHC